MKKGKLKVEFFAISEKGVREKNEDAILQKK